MNRTVVAVIALSAVALAACSGIGTDAAVEAPPATEPASLSPTEEVPQQSLWEQRPGIGVVVDGDTVATLPMTAFIWDDRGGDEDEDRFQPAVTLFVGPGAGLALHAEHEAQLSVALLRHNESLRFQQVDTVRTSGRSLDIVAPGEAGLYLVELSGLFGTSPDYAGNGSLFYAMWLDVTPSGAGCGAPPAGAFGVRDLDGCPVRASQAKLNLDALLPGFHCAPWPAILQLPEHRKGDRYLRTAFQSREPVLVELPTDAVTTGFQIPTGEVFVADSDTEAIFVQREDGATERWALEVQEVGCA